ncbi:MAG: DNA double-strand break repair nuclease NurA, partial [Candidatus Bathyarchaeia archaeon]
VVSVRRENKLFETATNFLSDRSAELILIDGPLAFGNWWAMKGEEKDRESLVRSVNRLLKLCEEEGIAIAGIVKRATARYLVNDLGIGRETSLSDAFILLQMMGFGERTSVFSPSEALKRIFHKAPFMDKILYQIYSFYIRLSSNPLTSPIRVDIPEFMLDRVDEIASYCLHSAVREGIPLPIVKADEEVR